MKLTLESSQLMLRSLVLLWLSLSAMGLAASCGGTPLGDGPELNPFVFPGLQSKDLIYNPEEGSYSLSWQGPDPKTGVYFIYKRPDDQSFDFSKPLTMTSNTSFTTPDLRFEGKSCFAVRFAQSKEEPQETNSSEACTTHSRIAFHGLDSLVRQEDGEYLLKWSSLAVSGLVFQIFAGKTTDLATVDFSEPISSTPAEFFRFDNFALGERRCFAVRYAKPGMPADTNVKSLCMDDNLLTDFTGIETAIPLDISTALLSWKRTAQPAVTGYSISIFKDVEGRKTFERKRNVGQSAGKNGVIEEIVRDLTVGEIYFFEVRAIDAGGHEDLNQKSLCVKVIGASTTKECPST